MQLMNEQIHFQTEEAERVGAKFYNPIMAHWLTQ